MGVICQMVMNKKDSFGNAREMRNLLEATIGRLSMRVSKISPQELTAEMYKIIQPEDIPTAAGSNVPY